ncbi:YigZ family protein [Corynebacterium aquatimens]|uniref:YigZ family protein n=1 Tax=Corynebacterium aquatimens TaxID=1190508 RepID=A0A931DXI8_9CORY|nr:YigZ family protein [Corynebacterium aquatimens]MBG6121940.1 putative YigZ family protein [Corynebacterium aquatimens]WJY65522.1 IMPACT family member YigZ [Corynebacterium aquatimens]
MESFELPRLAAPLERELTIKRSRFITWIARAESEEDAREVIAAAKHAYPDARHHCTAFIIHAEGAMPIERSSDDGEPAGTAGMPMLDVLRGSGLEHVVAVVARYFGGIKLGTGGLVHAYGESVSQALAEVPRAKRELLEVAEVDLAYAEGPRIEAALRRSSTRIVDTSYGESVTYTLGYEPGTLDAVNAIVAEYTAGAAVASRTSAAWFEDGERVGGL